MKKIIFSVLGLLLLAILFIGFKVVTGPQKMDVSKSITINAPASVVFDKVSTLKNWPSWSPWYAQDPKMEMVYSGPESGLGAKYIWKGTNDNTGTGNLEITKVEQAKYIQTKINMLTPMEDSFFADFNFVENEGKTTVTWSLKDELGFGEKVFNSLINFVGMVEKDYENGLANLKKISES